MTANLLPPPELLLAATNKAYPKNQPDFTYAMFGEDWMHIQVFVNAILKMPIATADFTKRYGAIDAGDEKQIKNFLGNTKDMQKLGLRFGDPVTIMQKIKDDGTYVTGSNAPPELYAHNIWMAYQVQNTAKKFTNRCGGIKGHLNDGKGAVKENAAVVRQFLTGDKGLKDLVVTLEGQLKKLIESLATFSTDFRGENDKLKLFIAKEGNIYKHAVAARKNCEEEAKELQKEADAAYAKWKRVTTAACCVAPFGFLGALVAIGLGIWAATLRKKWKALLDKVQKEQDKVQQKIQLVTDLDGLRTQVTPLPKYTDDFQQKLDLILGKWQNTSQSISELAKLDDSKLGDKDNINDVLDLEGATKEWQKVSDATEWFTQNALVMPKDTPFGTELQLQDSWDRDR